MIQLEGEVVDLKPIGYMCNLFIIIKNKNKKILWLPVLMVCLNRVGWKEKRKGEEVAGMYFVSVHPSLFHFSLLLSSSPISFYTNIGIGWQESSWNAFFLGNCLRF